jgi:hypothetical protein
MPQNSVISTNIRIYEASKIPTAIVFAIMQDIFKFPLLITSQFNSLSGTQVMLGALVRRL